MRNHTPHLLVAAFLVATSSVIATPTGLNNIPTADTVPHRTVAVQAFSSFGGDNQFAANGPGKHSFWTGFKTGLAFEAFGESIGFEWGLDSPIAPHDAGPLYGQAKLNFSPWEDGLLAFGVAGIAVTDIHRAGDPFSYAMLAHDFGLLRGHAGYGRMTDGDSVLLGVDRTWKVLDRNFNLNADLVQTRDQRGWLPAVGAKYDLNKHIVLETWSNFPDEGKVSFIAKINFVFTF